ncbi:MULTISPECIES: metal-sulfur cluster assembly factor [unclassified Mycobacterium]|uniref:metal-sulfur cluster assembly factor n=1 Tax=unclassified Mycobacterium TaxID=2642494 RepID=UPI0029C8B59F|nr:MULTISPECIES: iron-sulfur cluster assembly protein [unclassified Mycobacterium]
MSETVTEALIRATLDTVIDPCSVAAGARAGIAELGLVRSLQVKQEPDGAVVRVTIGTTDPGCLMIYPFAAESRRKLEALPGVARAEVDLDVSADWLPTDMSPSYRARLAARRSARRSQTGDRIGLAPDGTSHESVLLPVRIPLRGSDA